MSEDQNNSSRSISNFKPEEFLSGAGETRHPQSFDTNPKDDVASEVSFRDGPRFAAEDQQSYEFRLPTEFRVLRRLGRGGMGEVYLVERDTGFGKESLALKTILPEHLGNTLAVDRFIREIEKLKRLRHEHIVPLRDFRKYAGYYYFLMEYIDGATLDVYMTTRNPLSRDEALKLFMPLAEAIDYANRKGIIHRDIKPANIILDSNLEPFLLDFGIARHAGAEQTQTRRMGAGTWEYMAPEQFDDEVATPLMDVYAFGATLYYALLGRSPFAAVGIRKLLLDKDRGCPPISREGLSQNFIAGLRSSMEPDPTKRPKSCIALLERMQEKTIVEKAVPSALLARKGGVEVGQVIEASKSSASPDSPSKTSLEATGLPSTKLLEVRIPSLGEGVDECEVIAILVAPGDYVSAGQSLMEVETEKATVMIPSVAAGKVASLLVSTGQLLSIDALIMVLEPISPPAAPPLNKLGPSALAPASELLEVKLPWLGEGIGECQVISILVAQGDVVSQGQDLMEVETEKATILVPSPSAGKVARVKVSLGQFLSPAAVVVELNPELPHPAPLPLKQAAASALLAPAHLEVEVPSLGEGIDECQVTNILVAEGEIVSKGQNLLEVETDKACVTIPSPAAGKVARILVSSEEFLAIGDVIMELEPTATP
jgi:serine/threonine protein kinase